MADIEDKQPEDVEAGGSAKKAKDGKHFKEKRSKRKHSVPFYIGCVVVCVAVFLVAARLIVIGVAKYFTAQETVIRDTWEVDTGELEGSNEEYSIDIYDAGLDSDISVLQVVPTEISDEDFTYYDVDVQDRIAGAIETLKEEGTSEGSWSIEAPLAILNPYGTGSNGLYLYFETDRDTEVSYLIETEGCDDFSATAADGTTDVHEIQLIGLVPGETNHVTITTTGTLGHEEAIEFDITMPEDESGYPTQLDYEDGESTEELDDGLYTMMRFNGYLGYGFFFDNGGTMRYEMVLEGMSMDRVVPYEDDIIVCISFQKMARIDGLGRVLQVYDLGEYALHHDINYGEDGKIIMAAEYDSSDEGLVEDLVLELDVETGEVSLLVDFSELMGDFREEYTHGVEITGDSFWQVGEWDWCHINTVQYLEEDDSLIVSSRETSTIIKVENVHDDPEIAWLCGDPDFWEGTEYEDLVLEPVGDFLFQYGQHSVEYAGAGDEDGVYYLRMFDNNYWANDTRDDYTPDIGDEVGTTHFDFENVNSYIYVYKIDENEGTFELVESIAVPYSSIVSSASPTDTWENYRLDNQDSLYDMSDTNWVANSGRSLVFGEYDSDGNLIRQYSYEADVQAYRVIKLTMEGFWFAEEE